MDIGDKTSRCCMLDRIGEVVCEGSVGTTNGAMTQLYRQLTKCRITPEV